MISQLYHRTIMQKLLVLGLLLALAVVVCESGGRRYRYSSARAVCRLPRKVGKCGGVCIRYYYDRKKKACKKFKYSCCGGNANNFKSKSLCRKVCKKPRTCPRSPFCRSGVCKRQSCPRYPKATCVAVCPCQALWLYKGRDVTRKCYQNYNKSDEKNDSKSDEKKGSKSNEKKNY